MPSAGRRAASPDACLGLYQISGAGRYGAREISCLLRYSLEASDLLEPLPQHLLGDPFCSLADHWPGEPGLVQQQQSAAQAVRFGDPGGTAPPAKPGPLKAVGGEQGVRFVAEQCGGFGRYWPTVARSAPAWIRVDSNPRQLTALPERLLRGVGCIMGFLPYS